MTLRHAFLPLTLLCSPAIAQHVTSPRGFLDKEANSTTTFSLGDYRDGHYQTADGTHLGAPMTIKGTAYRLGNYAYTAYNGGGRSWSNVQLRVSECDGAQLSSTFTSNPTTTPTRVFSAAVSWASQLGKPQTFPAAWSMRFPFQAGFAYSGKQHICLDYLFTGGSLSNGKTWSSTRSEPLYKDAQNYPTYAYADSTRLGDWGANVGCNDRGVSHVYGAEIWSRMTVYGGDYSARLGNTVAFTQSGRYFPGNRPAMTVVGLRSLRQGVSLGGIACNKVHLDLTLPVFFIPSFSNSGGSLVTLNLSARNPGMTNVELVTQVLWNDSVTREPLLSNAAVLAVPNSPPAQPVSLLYHYDPISRDGWRSASRAYQPVVRYSR